MIGSSQKRNFGSPSMCEPVKLTDDVKQRNQEDPKNHSTKQRGNITGSYNEVNPKLLVPRRTSEFIE